MDASLLRTKARRTLEGKWIFFAGYTFLYELLTFAVPNLLEKRFPSKDLLDTGSVLSIAYWVFVTSAITLGNISLYLHATKGEKVSIATMFFFFSNGKSYRRAIFFSLLSSIYLAFWTLLLVVPGIIKSFSYAMAPYILLEQPDVTVNEAITKSRQMMDGYKWKLFCLYLSFAGWFLLSLLTFGIGLIWLIPYCQASAVHFYHQLKHRCQAAESDAGQAAVSP